MVNRKVPAVPAKFATHDKVYKFKGYVFHGTIASVFTTRAGEWRYVVEHDCGGLLHIFNAEQIKLKEPMRKRKSTPRSCRLMKPMKIHKAGHNDWPSQIRKRPPPPAPINKRTAMTNHWNYFDYQEIKREAIERLKEARLHHDNSKEKDTLEYWIAWAAHANAIAVATLIERSGGVS